MAFTSPSDAIAKRCLFPGPLLEMLRSPQTPVTIPSDALEKCARLRILSALQTSRWNEKVTIGGVEFDCAPEINGKRYHVLHHLHLEALVAEIKYHANGELAAAFKTLYESVPSSRYPPTVNPNPNNGMSFLEPSSPECMAIMAEMASAPPRRAVRWSWPRMGLSLSKK